ncbi:MAG: helix-turn-helix domain-containing protein [Sphingomonas sp.]
MTLSPAGTAQRYLRTPDAALILGLSARTMEKHRCFGTGPVFHKLGGRVVYALEDLHAWADRGIRKSTTDQGTDVIYPAKRRPEATGGHVGPVRR